MKEQIRQACIKANPDILKLEFGCYFNIPDSDHNPWMISETTVPQNAEILGRDIRLADVILALRELRLIKESLLLIVYSHGTGAIGRPDYTWNLREDSLEKQSEECITFISNLLK